MGRILTSEEIDDAFSQVSIVDNGKSGPDRASYGSLSSDDFELLIYALYRHRQGSEAEYDSARLMISGADQARDVWLTKDELPVGLIQCKRVKQGFPAPDAVREVIKFLLFTELEPGLLPEPTKFCFTLAVSADPAGTTTALFQAPKAWLTTNDARIGNYVQVVQAKYSAFKGLDPSAVLPRIKARLIGLRYRLLRPVDLDALLDDAPTVRRRFFKVQLVIAVDEAGAMLDAKFAAVGLLPQLSPPV
jgi:hypothetical protein